MQNNEFADNVKKTFDNPSEIKCSGFSHAFDTGIATSLGIEAAVVYNHLVFWLHHNKIKGINFIDGRTWTYDTHKDMAEYFPYFTPRQVKYALEKLFEGGVILKANYNEDKMDKTNWYALKDESPIHLSKNGYDKTKLSDRVPNPPMRQICPIEETDLSDRHNTYTKHTNIITSSMVPSEPSAVADEEDSNVPIEKSKKRKNPDYQPLVYEMSAKITALLVKYNPDYRIPKNMSSILAYVKLLTKDYTPERILQVLEWALKDNVERNNFKGWSSIIYGKNPAHKLRTHFPQISKQMASKPDRKFAASSDDERAIAVMEEMTRNAIR
jgi:hypothetical protein